MQNNPKYILVHCTDYSRSILPDQFVACNSWHEDRQFPVSSKGLFIGYHSLITGEQEYICRADDDEGAHCNQQSNGVSMNFQSLAVCVGMDGDIETPTAMEYALLQKRIWVWQDIYKIPNERVLFHRDFAKSKTCPGSLITRAWLDTLLKRPEPIKNIVPKPIESVCMAQEKEIVELKKTVNWYETIFKWLRIN